jgi:serine/threonine-protein kinase RIO1
MKRLAKAIAEVKFKDRPKNISTEFQMYGVYLAESLQDIKHYSLYIKLAKTLDRRVLEEALSFTKGYTSAKSRARVFMWKLKELRNLSALKKLVDSRK